MDDGTDAVFVGCIERRSSPFVGGGEERGRSKRRDGGSEKGRDGRERTGSNRQSKGRLTPLVGLEEERGGERFVLDGFKEPPESRGGATGRSNCQTRVPVVVGHTHVGPMLGQQRQDGRMVACSSQVHRIVSRGGWSVGIYGWREEEGGELLCVSRLCE